MLISASNSPVSLSDLYMGLLQLNETLPQTITVCLLTIGGLSSKDGIEDKETFQRWIMSLIPLLQISFHSPIIFDKKEAEKTFRKIKDKKTEQQRK